MSTMNRDSTKSVQESCIHGKLAPTLYPAIALLTRFFVVPGAGFEPALPFGKGGLRLHFHVRNVRLSPCDLLTSVGLVRPCPSDPPTSDGYGQVLCRNRAGTHVALSYLLSYHSIMAQRQKRSISLPADLAHAIDQAATAEGTTVSAWIAETAAHRLRIDAGRQGVAEWERQHGALTPEELADGLARARAVLRRQSSRKSA